MLGRLRAVHDPAYGRFSTLVRSTFDAAAAATADGSVDLLHVDGLHTYAAVRHDWDRWRPKLSGRAVVLFHDTAERAGDFGVWRLWAELSARYPSFAFDHAHGLGMLAVGAEVPAAVAEFLAAATARPEAVRLAFARLGEAVELDRAVRMAAESLAGMADDVNRWAVRTGRTAVSATADPAAVAGDVGRVQPAAGPAGAGGRVGLSRPHSGHRSGECRRSYPHVRQAESARRRRPHHRPTRTAGSPAKATTGTHRGTVTTVAVHVPNPVLSGGGRRTAGTSRPASARAAGAAVCQDRPVGM